MRVSSSFFYQLASSEMLRQQSEIARTQEQISTGKRLLRPSDDPVDAARSVNIKQSIEQLSQYQKNIASSEQQLDLEDTSLGSLTQLLHRVKELALGANSGAASAETRSAYRAEILQRFEELQDISNTRNASGNYLFSGYQGRVKPFSLSGGSVNYNGDQGLLFQQIGAARKIAVNDTGYDVFQKIRNGNGTFNVSTNAANTGAVVIDAGSVLNPSAFQTHNFTIRFTSNTTYDVINTTTSTTILSGQTYVDGGAISFNGIQTKMKGAPQTGDEFFINPSQNQSIFTTFQNLLAALSTNTNDASAKALSTQTINSAIADLDQSLNHVLNIRTGIGARLNSIESAKLENDAAKFELQTTLSQIQDLDYAEAISRLQFQIQSLEAAQKTFSSIESLSLFNFLR